MNAREELRHQVGQTGRGQMTGICNAETRKVDLCLGDGGIAEI